MKTNYQTRQIKYEALGIYIQQCMNKQEKTIPETSRSIDARVLCVGESSSFLRGLLAGKPSVWSWIDRPAGRYKEGGIARMYSLVEVLGLDKDPDFWRLINNITPLIEERFNNICLAAANRSEREQVNNHAEALFRKYSLEDKLRALKPCDRVEVINSIGKSPTNA